MNYDANRCRRFGQFFLQLCSIVVLFGSGRAQERLRIVTKPILPSAHGLIASDKGWFGELAMAVNEQRFTLGAPIVRSLQAGSTDVAYFGMAPALNAVSRGVKAKVLAAAISEPVTLVANAAFASVFEKSPSRAAFQSFRAKVGRPVRIASFPAGSTPNVMLLYWLIGLQIQVPKEVEIVTMGEDQLRLALLAQQVDAAMTVEPLVALARQAKPEYRPIAYGGEILKGHSESVLFVRQNLIDDKPEVAEKLVLFQLQAAKLLQEDKK